MQENTLDVFNILIDGGWVMIPLFILGLIIYGLGLSIILFFRKTDFRKATPELVRTWVEDPSKAEGQVGEILRYAQDDVESLEQIQTRFEEVRLSEIPRINLSIVVLSVLVNAAPLMGLLGTVLGMLTTFQGISMGGAEKTTDLVAKGISEALITTQMGLFLAIPGYFLVYNVKAKRASFESFLVRLESLTLQEFKRRSQTDDNAAV
jgi:biopolymer transport protein ExbB